MSGNAIQIIEDLSGLKQLKSLNLSANEIRMIPDLSALRSLKKLNLSANRILSMVNLKYLGTAGVELEFLDLSDNKLGNLKELRVLEGLKKLNSAQFHSSEEESNPFCADLAVYYSEILLLKMSDGFKIDGLTLNEALVKQRLLVQTANAKQESQNFANSTAQQGSSVIKPVANMPVLKPIKSQQLEDEKLAQKEQIALIQRVETETGEKTIPNAKTSTNVKEQVQEVRTADFKTNPFNLERKVIELTDLLAFKEQTFKTKEEDLKAECQRYQNQISHSQLKIQSLTDKIASLEKDNANLEKLLQTQKKADATETTLFERLEQSQAELFKTKLKIEQISARLAESEAEAKSMKEASLKAEFNTESLKSQLGRALQELQDSRAKQQSQEIDFEEKIKKWEAKLEETQTKCAELTLENARLSGIGSQIKAASTVEGEREKLELERRFASETAALNEKIAALEAGFLREKQAQEMSFHETLTKMETDFKQLIVELSNKNTELKKELSNAKTQSVA